MAKRVILPFEFGRIRLRMLEENDLPQTLEWRNQEYIRQWFFNSDIIQPAQHTAWFQNYQVKDNDFVFIIEEINRNYHPVGQVSLNNIDWATGQGEFGRLMIGEKDVTGKGLAYEATQAALLIAHRYLNLRRIFLEVYCHNHRAIKIYQNAGFTTNAKNSDILRMVINLE